MELRDVTITKKSPMMMCDMNFEPASRAYTGGPRARGALPPPPAVKILEFFLVFCVLVRPSYVYRNFSQNFKHTKLQYVFIVLTLVCLKNKLELWSRIKIVPNISKIPLKFLGKCP